MNEIPVTPQALERAITGEPEPIRVQVSQSRPSFRCTCGHEIGPNEGRQIFKANVKLGGTADRPTHYGAHVYAFTCPACGNGHVVESAASLTVAVPPVGEARNAPCPCASGKKAKRRGPDGFVAPAGAHDKHP